MKTTKIEGNICPYCGLRNDGASSYKREDEEYTPSENDFSICFYCCEVSVFNKNLKLEKVDNFVVPNEVLEQQKEFKRFKSMYNRKK